MNPALSTHKTRRSPLAFVGICLLVLSLAAIFCLFGVTLFGVVDHEEFSPFALKRRRTSYFRLPLTNLQLTPASRNDTTNSFERFLATSGYATGTQPKRWDVVRARPTNRAGDAEYLCFYLDTPRNYLVGKTAGTHVWQTWSEKNPAMAKYFWPIVIGLARDELYTLVPELFEICKRAEDPDELKTNIDRHLEAKFVRLADKRSQLERPDAVVDVCSKGLKLLPKHRELLRRRAEAYRKLGNDEKAAADEKAASQAGKTESVGEKTISSS